MRKVVADIPPPAIRPTLLRVAFSIIVSVHTIAIVFIHTIAIVSVHTIL